MTSALILSTMKTGQALLADGTVWAAHCERASGFFDRLRGLLGRSGTVPDSALLIDRCGAVHTVGMRFPIDLVFVDSRWEIVRVVPAVPPGRLMVVGGWRAAKVYEAEAGRLPLSKLSGGSTLQWRPNEPEREVQCD